MALTQVKTLGIEDDAVTTDKLADAINTARDANTAKVSLENDSVTSAKIADDAVVAAAIADDAVDEARLQISNAGTNGQYLQKQSGNTGGLTWADVPAGVGGATGVDFDDSVKVQFGAGDDLQLWSDGTNGIVRAATNRLYVQGQAGVNITNNGNTADYIVCDAGGKVELNHNNIMKLETNANGVTVDGNLGFVSSGQGIDFGATSNASPGTMSSELFDDYEEGSWTPDVRFNDTSASGQTTNGRYTKIGRIVYASYQFTLTNKGSGDGQFHLNGFPYSPSSGWSDIGHGFGYFHRFADTNNDNGQVYPQFYSSIMYLAFRGLNNNTVRLTDDNFRNDCAISGMIIYRTDA